MIRRWAFRAIVLVMTIALVWGIWLDAGRDTSTPNPSPSPGASP